MDKISREQVLKIINPKLQEQELYLKQATTDFRKRLYSHTIAILRDIKFIIENIESK